MNALEKYATKRQLAKQLADRLGSLKLTESQKLELHRYLMPGTVGTAMWGITGAALAKKGDRKKAFLSGAALGAVRPMLWKALGKGYAKAVKRPFSELIK